MRTVALAALLLLACNKSASPPPAHHEDRDEPAVAAPALALAVAIGGEAVRWGPEAFARAPKLAGKARSGEARDVWSLRALAEANVGPGARVVAVTGDRTVTIAPEAWRDPVRTPILHTTRRGTLKFRWAEADGTWEDAAVHDVTGLTIER